VPVISVEIFLAVGIEMNFSNPSLSKIFFITILINNQLFTCF